MKHFTILLGGLIAFSCSTDRLPERPNVVFILTDDQGYGDIAANGNPYIQTPNIDRLISEGYSFTDFHSATTSAPTRSGIMSGVNCNSAGVWHTVGGRSLLSLDRMILPGLLAEGGYTTGMFGKWHLGDYYPYRPHDRGFQEALYHGGGGVGQSPDVWNNDYYNDTYYRNGKKEKFSGYCTDVWFREAISFIDRQKDSGKPFFCYIATNAPHGPWNVEQKYADLYNKNKKVANPNFYGMITNLDEHIGKLMEYLKASGLDKNTVVVYMTDNGTAAGFATDKAGNIVKGYNAGMKGKKGSAYEGGHRVPFVIRYPEGRGKKIGALASYLDILPTFLDLCGLKDRIPSTAEGQSLLPLLKKDEESERFLFADTQRDEYLEKGKNSCVMYKKWRLVNNSELYDIHSDPGEEHNVAAANPDLVKKMNRAYDQWWTRNVAPAADRYELIPVGTSVEPRVLLYSHDLHSVGKIPICFQDGIRSGFLHNNGFWSVDVKRPGTYKITMYRWEPSLHVNLDAAAPVEDQGNWGSYRKFATPQAIKGISKGELYIDKKLVSAKDADNEKPGISFETELSEGMHFIQTDFVFSSGKRFSAYYATVEHL